MYSKHFTKKVELALSAIYSKAGILTESVNFRLKCVRNSELAEFGIGIGGIVGGIGSAELGGIVAELVGPS